MACTQRNSYQSLSVLPCVADTHNSLTRCHTDVLPGRYCSEIRVHSRVHACMIDQQRLHVVCKSCGCHAKLPMRDVHEQQSLVTGCYAMLCSAL